MVECHYPGLDCYEGAPIGIPATNNRGTAGGRTLDSEPQVEGWVCYLLEEQVPPSLGFSFNTRILASSHCPRAGVLVRETSVTLGVTTVSQHPIATTMSPRYRSVVPEVAHVLSRETFSSRARGLPPTSPSDSHKVALSKNGEHQAR